MLWELPAARLTTREEEDVYTKVVQMHKDGATLRVSVHILLLKQLLYLCICLDFPD